LCLLFTSIYGAAFEARFGEVKGTGFDIAKVPAFLPREHKSNGSTTNHRKLQTTNCELQTANFQRAQNVGQKEEQQKKKKRVGVKNASQTDSHTNLQTHN